MAFGALLGQTASGGGGKRVCRFTVGTSTAGWTANDCDYLCDGTADDVEINAAIQALPAEGGEIIILDGTYNITATIAMNKDNVTLSGNGSSTVLKRMWNSSSGDEGIVTVMKVKNCIIRYIFAEGNKQVYPSTNNNAIYANTPYSCFFSNILQNNGGQAIKITYGGSQSTIIGNQCINSRTGISISQSSDVVVVGNICNNNNNSGIIHAYGSAGLITGNYCEFNGVYGIFVSSVGTEITGNVCRLNDVGIYLSSYKRNNITGNDCFDNNTGIYLLHSDYNTIVGNNFIRDSYSSSQYTIYLSGTNNNYNLISSNNIMGKNYVDDGGTNNTFVNNKYN